MLIQDKTVESLVVLINQYFDMEVNLGKGNIPYVKSAKVKDNRPVKDFLNDFLNIIENTETEGKLMYYFDNQLDFDTPEEYHRY